MDTNILVYAQQTGDKAAISQDLITDGGKISAQVLHELANVLHKKQGRNWDDINCVLDDIGNTLDPAVPLTAKINRSAVALARDHSIAFYDARIVAAAAEAGCDTLFTEDMQHGRSFGGLTIINPFLNSAS